MTKPRTPQVPEITPEEEALLARIEAEADPDDIFPTEAELAVAARRGRGRPKLANARVHVSLRLDADVLAAFKAQGPGWQTRINEALRLSAQQHQIAEAIKLGFDPTQAGAIEAAVVQAASALRVADAHSSIPPDLSASSTEALQMDVIYKLQMEEIYKTFEEAWRAAAFQTSRREPTGKRRKAQGERAKAG